jgi:sulfide:quinone oxidoreductase
VRELLAALERGEVQSVGFVAAPGASWTLPLYELAFLTSAWCADRHLPGVALSVTTAEDAPLEMFGAAAGAAVGELMSDRGITFRREEPSTDAVVTLPQLLPPQIVGLPEGFIEVDEFCRVAGMDRAFAIGDAADHGVKQGGLATQQADVAAAAIAHDLDLGPAPEPYDPVLRGLLLTGMTPAYLRNGGGEAALAAFDALWWPPSKVAGRLLGPYLADAPSVGGLVELEERSPAHNGKRAARDREELRRIAIDMAEADARFGDYRSALRWLQTIEWLDGTLTEHLASMRERWQTELFSTRAST